MYLCSLRTFSLLIGVESRKSDLCTKPCMSDTRPSLQGWSGWQNTMIFAQYAISVTAVENKQLYSTKKALSCKAMMSLLQTTQMSGFVPLMMTQCVHYATYIMCEC